MAGPPPVISGVPLILIGAFRNSSFSIASVTRERGRIPPNVVCNLSKIPSVGPDERYPIGARRPYCDLKGRKGAILLVLAARISMANVADNPRAKQPYSLVTEKAGVNIDTGAYA